MCLFLQLEKSYYLQLEYIIKSLQGINTNRIYYNHPKVISILRYLKGTKLSVNEAVSLI